jgi:hypothetical protein
MAEPLAAGGEVACARPAFRAGRGATVAGLAGVREGRDPDDGHPMPRR